MQIDRSYSAPTEWGYVVRVRTPAVFPVVGRVDVELRIARSRMRRRPILVGLIVLAMIACQSDEDGNDVVATTSHSEPTDDQLASMYRAVIREVCESAARSLPCDGQIRVSEDFSGDPDPTTEKLPDLVRSAAQAELPNVTFIDPESWNGSDYLILLGPSEMPLPDTVEIPAGYLCGDLCGQGTTYFFQRNGEAWEQASADDLGLFKVIWES